MDCAERARSERGRLVREIQHLNHADEDEFIFEKTMEYSALPLDFRVFRVFRGCNRISRTSRPRTVF